MTIDRIIDAPRPQRPDEPLRHVLEEHHHVVADDADGGEWVTLPVRAAVVDSLGPHVELGPYSLVPDDARLLALSLTVLADAAALAAEESTDD